MMVDYIIMNRATFSEEYETVRVGYPSELNHACHVCRSNVKYRYPDNGKLVYTLEGDVYQVVNLYQVVNFKFFLIPKIVNKTVSSLKSALREAR